MLKSGHNNVIAIYQTSTELFEGRGRKVGKIFYYLDKYGRYFMGCQVGKKHLLFTYMAIIFSLMNVIFYHIGTI